MLVGNGMTKEPITISADMLLTEAQEKMRRGGFRRLPVVVEGQLVGIITDRDLRAHIGYFERTRVNGVVTEQVRTVSPATTLEESRPSIAQISDRRFAGG